jgi:RNase P/RNase MRP subunit POP5
LARGKVGDLSARRRDGSTILTSLPLSSKVDTDLLLILTNKTKYVPLWSCFSTLGPSTRDNKKYINFRLLKPNSSEVGP